MLRFAQSLTEDLNLGSLRIALLYHILSKQKAEELFIRIDDTDKEHNNIKGKDKEILEMLALFGIDYSRVIIQSDNIKYHTGMGMQLLLNKKAFNCFCSDEALEQDRIKAKEESKPYSYSGFCETISDEAKFQCNAPFVVRIKKPDHTIKFTDSLKGNCEYNPFEVDSFIILDTNKKPTYNFASAIDDMLYDISTIIEDDRHLLNTPKQIHVRESLGYDKKIEYTHLPTISDLDDSFSVKQLVDEGYLPIAIANYLLHLGYTSPKEIFTVEEAIEWFDIDKLSKDPAQFDINKLNLINREHMKMLEDMRFSKIIGYADEDIGKLAKIYIEECNTIKEIKEKIEAIFSKKNTLKGYEEEFQSLKKCLQNAPFIKEFDKLQKYITEKTGLKDEKLSVPLSFILTGTIDNQNLKLIYPLIRNYLGEII